MKLGRVIGKVISSRKEGNLDGLRMLVVSYLNEELKETGKTSVCIDTVNAGEGEIVITCSSSSARLTNTTRNAAADNAIVGIVDAVSAGNKYLYRKNN